MCAISGAPKRRSRTADTSPAASTETLAEADESAMDDAMCAQFNRDDA
jgi:hypothetical protein